VATHYDVLGVRSDAPPEDVRRAYLDRARALHPDRAAATSTTDADRAARRMQEVNEAWRILRDPNTRAAYDRTLAARDRVASATPPPRPASPHLDDDDLDRPFEAPLAQPGDVTVSIARAIPWVAVLIVLVAIFVFTAYAGHRSNDSGPRALLNRCVVSGSASTVRPVPCDGPNEGKVVRIVDRASLCERGSTSRSIEGNQWLCLMPVDSAPSGTEQR
jgi:hypothetical protein